MHELQLQSQQYGLEIEDKTAEYTKDILIAKLKIENIKTQLRTQEENLALSQESTVTELNLLRFYSYLFRICE